MEIIPRLSEWLLIHRQLLVPIRKFRERILAGENCDAEIEEFDKKNVDVLIRSCDDKFKLASDAGKPINPQFNNIFPELLIHINDCAWETLSTPHSPYTLSSKKKKEMDEAMRAIAYNSVANFVGEAANLYLQVNRL